MVGPISGSTRFRQRHEPTVDARPFRLVEIEPGNEPAAY